MSLRANVIAAIVTATAALVLAIALLEGPLVDHRQNSRTRTELSALAAYVHAGLEAGQDPDSVADQTGAEHGVRVSVFSEARQPLGDTAFNPPDLADRVPPLADQDLTTSSGTGWHVGPGPGGEPTLFVVMRHSDWIVRVSRPHASVQAVRGGIRELILAGGLIAILTSVLLGYVITSTMVRPIERLTRTADALAQGDLAARARIGDRRDEVGRIGRSLDKMANRLEKQLKHAQAGEQRLRTMLDSMVEGVFVTDRAGRITLFNKALDAMVDPEPSGKKVNRVISEPKLKKAVVAARRGKESIVEIVAELKGEERALQVHLAPLPQKEGVVAVLHDITAMKRSERIRSDFVANASHELRTPLTAIRGFAETLRDTSDPDPVVSERFLDAILRHTHRLQRLVDDLLALSRAESADQQFELGPVTTGPIITDIASGLEAQSDQKGIAIVVDDVDGLPAVAANAWALDHVMVNLIDNAVKYTPEGGRVTVRGRQLEDAVALEVHDTGPGIADDQKSRIFERFYRVDAGRTRDQGGTGLGLAIVKHLVLRMGGEIEVESEAGSGTVFRVTLPTAESLERESAGDIDPEDSAHDGSAW